MDLLIGLLTIVLVLNCLFLILLILVQLPKKDAGAGVAFGGGTTDALFGSGTGTVLTKATRYGTTAFLVLSLGLSVLQSHQAKASRDAVLQELESRAASAPAVPAAATNGDVAVAPAVTTETGATGVTNPAPADTEGGSSTPSSEASENATTAGVPEVVPQVEGSETPISPAATNAPPPRGGE